MSLQTDNSRITHTGNGITTVFSVPFRFDDSDELQVTLITIATGAAAVLPTVDYSVSGALNPLGGTVTYAPGGTPIANTHKLRIERIVGFTQDLIITREGVFDPTAIELQLDRIVMMAQQLKSDLALAVSGDEITTITGQVSGPSSSVSNNLAAYDGATGKILKDSGYDVADFAAASHSHDFLDLTNIPTTVTGYGIADFTETAVDAIAAALALGTHTGVTVTYDDSGGSISLASSWTKLARTTDSSIVSNTTLTSDSVLQFTVAANSLYHIKAIIAMDAPATPGHKIGFTGPAGFTSLVARFDGYESGVNFDSVVVAYGSVRAVAGAKIPVYKVDVLLANGAAAGTFAFQFAQNTSNAAAVIVKAGSYLEYQKLT